MDLNNNILYKYRILTDTRNENQLNEHTISMLTNAELFFQHPSKFNDPFDLCITHEDVIKDRELLISLKKLYPSYSQTTLKKTIRTIRTQSGGLTAYLNKAFAPFVDPAYVYCLSRDCLSPLMWGYYADNGKGICIGIKTHRIGKGRCIITKPNQFRSMDFRQFGTPLPDNYLPLWTVNYTKERPTPITLNDFTDNCLQEKLYNHLRSKDQKWCHEQEERVLIPNSFHIKQNIEIPYEEISEIIFGPRTNIQQQEQVKDIISKYPNNGNWITFYKIEPSNTTYELVKISID